MMLPVKSSTIPAITRTTAAIHKTKLMSRFMALCYPALPRLTRLALTNAHEKPCRRYARVTRYPQGGAKCQVVASMTWYTEGALDVICGFSRTYSARMGVV